jgi:beta-galactosidase
VLDLLVEDQGRVDYGPRIGEPKGLIGPAFANGGQLTGWSVLPLDLADIEPVAERLRSKADAARVPARGAETADPDIIAGPAFARAAFDAPTDGDGRVLDLFLDTAAWGKGVAWINGFCLGRYWSRGPQRTLYVPGPVLKAAGNELVVFELHATTTPKVTFLGEQELGHTEF